MLALVSDKELIYNYVDNYVEDPILKTFNTLWEERGYWKYHPIVYVDNGIIKGFVAYTINEKYPGKLKVYYLHVREDSRGKGIATTLMNKVVCEAIDKNVDLLYITEENTDGSKLFKGIDYTVKLNEFGTTDKIYDIPVDKLSKMFI